ncbi:MAG TPA: VOC family protein [Candidatus Sulfotelmatobacter sp.]|nr:VOC family protein [Candidatus Sulfotelmatobacter sp.]
MLNNSPVTPTIAVTDLKRAKDFYGGKLGLTEDSSMSDENGVLYNAGLGSKLYIYSRPNPPTADHTQVSFKVDNIDTSIDELSSKGVTFEHYDMPEMGLKTDEKGVATLGKVKSAWFKDPDGNILSLLQV